jgi:hypothetical protein
MTNIERVSANLRKMFEQGAPQTDMESYIRMEGYTPQRYLAAMGRMKRGVGEVEAGAFRTFMQGLSFGFSDEIEAAVKAAFTKGSYQDNVEAVREGIKQYQKQNPVAAMSSELAGALLPAAVTMGAAAPAVAARAPQLAGAVTRSTQAVTSALPSAMQGTNIGAQVSRGALYGAAGGALGGAGQAEGDMSSRLQGAAVGAGLGGAIGAAVPPAMGLIGYGAGKARDVLGRSGAAAQQKASQLIIQGMERDQLTPQELQRRLMQSTPGKPTTLADIGGESLLSRASGAVNVPGAAKSEKGEFLQERVRTQSDRVIADLAAAAQERLQNTNTLLRDLTDQQKQKAAPLYAKAYDTPVGVLNDKELLKYLDRPAFKKAYARAVSMAANEGESLPQIYRFKTDGNGRPIYDEDGLPVYGDLEDLPNVKVLDWMKRGLDDVINAKQTKEGFGSTEARVIRNAKNEFLNRLDELVPSYRDARAVFAGDAALKDAIEQGRKIFTMPENDWREVAADFNKLTDMERNMFRAGVVDAAKIQADRITREFGTARDVTRLFDNTQTLGRLRSAFPDDQSFNTFKNQLGEEARFTEVRNRVLAGSRTAPLTAEMAEQAGPTGAAVGSAIIQGNLQPIASQILGRAMQRGAGNVGDVADILGRELLTPLTPQSLDALMKRLASQQEAMARAEVNRANVRPMVGGALGQLTGQAAAPTQPFRLDVSGTADTMSDEEKRLAGLLQ